MRRISVARLSAVHVVCGEVSEFYGEKELALDLGQRAARDRNEVCELSPLPRVSLREIRRHRHGGAPDLRCQSESLVRREPCGEVAHRLRELDRPLPDVQIAEAEYRRAAGRVHLALLCCPCLLSSL
jgi:hypothetical protein